MITLELLTADADLLADVARSVTGLADATLDPSAVRVDVVPVVSLTTGELARVRGTATDADGDVPWSAVVKIVQSPSRSPAWDMVPEQFRAAATVELPWRSEADVYASPLRNLLPADLRMPLVHRVDEIDDGAMAIWMEDVDVAPGSWTLDDHRHVARLLGRMAGRHVGDTPPDGIPVRHRDLRGYLHGRVRQGALPPLLDDATWAHPLVAAHVDPTLRDSLVALDARADDLLDRADTLPLALAHGDACPANLLRATDGGVVAIDWQFAGMCAVGFDAGHLVAGDVEDGDLPVDRVDATLDAAVTAYIAGVQEHRPDIPAADIRLGAFCALVIRSAFTALPIDRLTDPDPDLGDLLERRTRWTRFLIDLASALAP